MLNNWLVYLVVIFEPLDQGTVDILGVLVIHLIAIEHRWRK